jgi:hypothetical protein
MSNRAQRRAAERAALKLARKVGHVEQTATPIEGVPEPGAPFPSLAQLTSNCANAQLSTGPVTPEGRATSSQNRTVHGLARHNGSFKLLPTEDPVGFEALKQSLLEEHQPSTETESILVASMAESHWLSRRAQRLQDEVCDAVTGHIVDQKAFSLYLRYQTTHQRAFHKSLNDLLKVRSERRKAEFGFEAQSRKEEDHRIKTERHAMKKQTHYWDVLRKDGEACHQLSQNTLQNLNAAHQHPDFEAQLAAELGRHGFKRTQFAGATPAA